jgi:hypothetical protein
LTSSEHAAQLPAGSAGSGAAEIAAASDAGAPEDTPLAPGNGAAQMAPSALQNGALAGNIVIREVEYIQALTERINALIASNERVIKMYGKYFWYMGMLATFFRGILMGFGWVLGTTIVVGVFVLFLHKFVSVPVVGEFVRQIMDYLEQRR